MKQSLLFTKTIKELPKDETSYNAQVLIRAGFIDKVSAGVYTFLPLGLKVLHKINNIIREEINAVSGQEILMPALNPKENWQKTGRWDDLDVLFKLIGSDDKEYALGATHEEIVTPLGQKFTLSYKDLPFAVYQIQTKFRNEKRAKAGLLRGREFVMKDLYSFHADEESLSKYYNKVKEAYEKIYNRLGLGDLTYFTYAAGGTFSKYSHEFQTVCENGEDIIYVCPKCHIAINKEIISEQNACFKCGNTVLEEKKAIEVGNIFELKTKYSKAFNFTFKDKDENNKEVLMGCYGMGPSRIMGTIVEICHDDKGMIWPKNVAPFSVHLISLKQNEEAEKIYQKLLNENIEVLYDDRDNVSPGEKFADADLIGCPIRLVVSSKTLDDKKIEFKLRTDDEIKLVDIDNLSNFLKNYK
ncbi:MAG TPA: His/Gly/Thr/Pro-type tRNA ligase C-terminal domain-containing protein [bacterium]|nr:His/Gly/Thr/Pro-type tRNA ligase C-terminal domain-containing protein [bacterium]